jgi:pimeloyl-ACP methyl ester carboxylesterase
VHGAWVTPRSWDAFRRPFEAEGYEVHAPTWPYLDGMTLLDAQGALPGGFGGLTLGRIADKYQSFIDTLPEPPVLIGHSFGGLLVQILLDRGLGAVGVGLNPAPIGGIVPGPSALAAIAPILLRFNGWNRPYAFTREQFGRLFANGAPADQVDAAYRDYVIPAPGMIFHEAAFSLGTRVRPERRTQPLLITAGTSDRLISPYLSRAAYRLQRKSPAPTDYVEFEGRSHLLIGEPGWEEVALHTLSWIERNFRPQATMAEADRSARPAAAHENVPALAGFWRQ